MLPNTGLFMPSQVPTSIHLFLIHSFIWQKYFYCSLHVPAPAKHTLQARTGERTPLHYALVYSKNTRLLPQSIYSLKITVTTPYTYTHGGEVGVVGVGGPSKANV